MEDSLAAKKGLGELLVKKNVISFEELQEAKQSQKVDGGRLMSALVRKGYVKENELSEFLAKEHNLPVIDLSVFDVDPSLIKLVPKRICEKYLVFPVQKADRTLVIAFADPRNIYVKDDLTLITRCKIEVVVTSESNILNAIESYYEGNNKMDKLVEELDEEASDESSQEVEVIDGAQGADSGPIIKYVNAMLSEAIKSKASDIHIEPYEKRLRIRFRVNGFLIEKQQPPPSVASAIVSRIKVLCKMDISQKRLPQDGRLKVKMKNGGGIDFRVNSLPMIFGEKVVLRVLDKSNLEMDLANIGFDEREYKLFKDAIYAPQGMVLITGPTGSGKTTTIYSGLSELNTSKRNISTAEDPVEFNLDGINQVQINSEIGFDFPATLRAFLRQDPEIIMVGEIRDLETGKIAYKAASTGHMVLSTLHTNDAVSTVMRLFNMGLPKFMVAEATSIVVAQRLIKTVCKNCSEIYEPKKDVLLDLGVPENEIDLYSEVKKSNGCTYCLGTGMQGRRPVFEVLDFQENIRESILSNNTGQEIKKIAVHQNGMKTLRMNALVALQKGLTTVEEVINVTVKDNI